MAAPIQSQPPKPPPPPPKVEEAPKPAAEAKPAAAPKPAQTPDLFEVASGGGRGVPTNGGSSFMPAVSSANATFNNAINGARTDLQSAFGSVNNAVQQSGAYDFQGFASQDFSNLFGGGAGPVGGSPSPSVFYGGAPGGVVDKPAPFMNLSDTFSKNFGPFGSGNANLDWALSNQGGGGKPGIGGSTDFLSSYGGGASPVSSSLAQPAVATQPSNNSSRNLFDFDFGGFGRGNRFGVLFNLGNARGGGGGAAGGVADRSGPRYEG